MSRLPNPSDGGFADVGFITDAGSALYFIVDQNPNVKPGSSYFFTSSGLFSEYNGEYVVGSVVQDGSVWNIYTTCIGTAFVVGN